MLASPLARSFYLAHWVLVTGIAYVAADMMDETIRTKLENISPPVRAGVSLIPKNHSLPSEEDLRLIVSRNPFSPESRGSKYLPGSFDLSDDTVSGKSASSGNGEVVPVETG